jgi:hypothetical protein
MRVRTLSSSATRSCTARRSRQALLLAQSNSSQIIARRPQPKKKPVFYLTVCFSTAETLVFKFVSPEYFAVVECVPTANVLVVNLAL